MITSNNNSQQNVIFFPLDVACFSGNLKIVFNLILPHSPLVTFPVQLSASGDSGMPEVVADPLGEVAGTFQELGVCVVQQCAKIRQQGKY